MSVSDSIQTIRQIFLDGGWSSDDDFREEDLSQSCHVKFPLSGWSSFIHGDEVVFNLRKHISSGMVECNIYQLGIPANQIVLDFNGFDFSSDPSGCIFFLELISELSIRPKGKFYVSLLIDALSNMKLKRKIEASASQREDDRVERLAKDFHKLEAEMTQMRDTLKEVLRKDLK